MVVVIALCCGFFFFKQKTAYEMRISDWSSDVCSSDLGPGTIAMIQSAGSRPDVLQQILRRKQEEVAERAACLPLRELSARVVDAPPVRGFAAAIEIGRASCRERVGKYV